MKAVRVIPVLLVAVALSAQPTQAGFNFFEFFQNFFNQPAPPPEEPMESITDLAIATPELSTLVDAVLKAELATTLAEDGDFTVFAPTNEAFAAAGIDPANVDKATLTAVLLDHVAPGDLSKQFLNSQSRTGNRLATIGGLTLGFDRAPFAVNGNEVVISNIEASNGRVFVIDGVLTRPAPSITDRAIATPSLSTLVQAVVKAGLATTLAEGGPFTAFVPTDEAFAAAGIDPTVIDAATLEAVLKDHVVIGEFTSAEISQLRFSGSGLQTLGGLDLTFRSFPLRVNDIRIVGTNVSASNGVIHLINGVLLED